MVNPDALGPVFRHRAPPPSDNIADPAGEADNLHSEKLVRLKNSFLCYEPNKSAPAVSSLPCLTKGLITFGSFNNITKTTTEVVKIWSEILNAVPDTHLVLKCKQFVNKGTKERYLKLFAEKGIPAERIILFPQLPKIEDHLNFYNEIDIGLDPFPYNGTTTTCEALWMGVPVVTIMGDRHAGRVGASIMNQIGLRELLVAENEKKYIEIAVSLAKNIDKLSMIRKHMRQKMINSPLCDAQFFAQKIENAYKKMWGKYISNQKEKQ